MPKEEFCKEYLYLRHIEKLANKFLVSDKAVQKRIIEVGLNE